MEIFKHFPESVFQSRIRLQLVYARTLVLSGQVEEAMLRLNTMEEHLEQVGLSQPESRRYLGMILTNRATRLALSGDLEGTNHIINRALECLPQDEVLTRVQAVHTMGLIADAEGRLQQAAFHFQQAGLLAMQANHRNLAVTSASQQAFSEIELGELKQAEVTVRQGLLWATIGSTELPISAYAHTALAEVFRQQNHLDLAEQEINRAVFLAEKAIPMVRWHTMLIQAKILLSRHNYSAAQDILQQSETSYRPILPSRFIQITHAFLCQVWVLLEQFEMVEDWAKHIQEYLSAPAYYQDFNHEAYILIFCRAQLAGKEKELARQLLQKVSESASRQEHKAVLMETLILQALCAETITNSHDYLQKAFTLAEPQGYQRIFLDEGQPLLELIKSYRQQFKSPLPFVNQLLNAFQQEFSVTTYKQLAQAPGIESLTERERDVLIQIARGASNQQIADRLVVSIHTVKKHAANIFIKLGVQNRTEAVDRARSYGLI
jgi:LuxR family maltose regulon positive regulatory protein